MPSEPAPWDRLPDEPPENYARFLAYRNLGPGRSIALAYTASRPASERRKSPHPSGQWQDDSARWGWTARATAWDVHHLAEHGEELATLWIAIVVRVARKAAEKLLDPRCRPTTFTQCANVIEKLAGFLTPELIATITARQQQREPADSCILDRLHRTEE